ncbi:20709_t:CDS:2, partial [Dentiscutata erythropus]
MEYVFNYHLKQRLSIQVNWIELFQQWLTKTSTIIELQSSLQALYPPYHKINDCELRAWKAILKATEYTEITLFDKNQSVVKTGQDIENAIKEIQGTSVTHLQPNRTR